MELISLDKLSTGAKATIVNIDGGMDMLRRLDALGVREGSRVEKLSKVRMGGPVILVIDRAQVAIGRGMAEKINVVEVVDEQ